MRRTVVSVLTLCVAFPAGASAAPMRGPRETIDLTFTSVLPNSPSGYRYREVYRNPSNASADPPAVRGITFVGPPGGRTDTRVIAACAASDDQLRRQGDGACPANSRIGAGTTTYSVLGARMSSDIHVFNAPAQELDVVEFGGHAGSIVRNRYTSTGFANTIPTCITGGQPPQGCPFDQVHIISTDQSAAPVVGRRGARWRALVTTPPTCPRSGRWPISFATRYADGVVDHLSGSLACTRPGLRVRRRGCRARVRLTGRDLHEVTSVDIRRDGRLVRRDRRAPFATTLRLRPGRRHRIALAVHAHGVTVVRLHRRVRACG